MNNLLTWRNRYSKSEYPEKVVLNIFYRKYTMELMFPDIVGCFENESSGKPKVKWSDFNEGFQKLKTIYGSTATSKTHPVLMNLLAQQEKNVGNTNYGIFARLQEGKIGKCPISSLEEISAVHNRPRCYIKIT